MKVFYDPTPVPEGVWKWTFGPNMGRKRAGRRQGVDLGARAWTFGHVGEGIDTDPVQKHFRLPPMIGSRKLGWHGVSSSLVANYSNSNVISFGEWFVWSLLRPSR